MKTLMLNSSHLRATLALLSLGAVAPLSAFVNVSLPGISEFEGWADLNGTNYSSPTYPDSFMSYTAAWGDDVDANVAGSAGNAALMKVSGGGYFSTTSIYSFDTPGTFSITNTDAVDGLSTVVFQLEAVGTLDAVPTLSFNGGTQSLLADFTFVTAGDTETSFGDSTVFGFQWDLSTFAGITDYQITYTGSAHLAQIGMQLNSGNTFAGVAVPEPSTYAAIFGSLALLTVTVRRRLKR